jgi:trans-aconitate methyltransferase
MKRPKNTLLPEYFDAIYTSDPDPWRFATSPYERSKYAATIAALPQPRYVHAFEVGCSIGVLTAELAPRCDALLAVDAAAAPLNVAKRRCAQYAHVRFEQMFVPNQWPEQAFDLVLLSEVVYYLSAEDVRRLAAKVVAATTPEADIVLVHWTRETDYPLSGDDAANLFIAGVGSQGRLERSDRHDSFRLDVLVRL